MATYTAPTTRTTGALISASIWNTDIVENLKYFKDAPVFDGDISVGDDIFLTSTGAVINFASGDVTITHSTNTLTFAGAASGYVFNDGNVGIGVTPSAWNTAYKVLQIGERMALWNSGGTGLLGYNTFVDSGGNFKYIATAAVSVMSFTSGLFQFYNAPSGTSGNTATLTERFRVTEGGDVAIGATAKLYLDGVAGTGDTYIYEQAANTLDLVAGGINIIRCTTTGALINNTKNLTIGATAKFYLDGGGDTYIHENSSNLLITVVGGTNLFASVNNPTKYNFSYEDFAIDAGKKFYVDGLSDTYITQYDANRFGFYAGGTLVALISAASVDSRGTTGIGYYAGSANTNTGTAVVRNADGYLYLTSSSRRFKENISTAVVTDAQLDAFMATTPSWWDYTGQKNGALGFIAEDLAALPMERYGFNPLVNYDAEGQIESNRDYALIAMHHLVIQRLERKIAALEARIH